MVINYSHDSYIATYYDIQLKENFVMRKNEMPLLKSKHVQCVYHAIYNPLYVRQNIMVNHLAMYVCMLCDSKPWCISLTYVVWHSPHKSINISFYTN